jgi:branched-chain amino acid transport system permease protein
MGGLLAGAFGIALGVPALRLQGDYLAIASIAFAEIVRLLAINWQSLTRGPMGLPGIPSPVIFGFTIDTQMSFYYLVGLFVLITIYVAVNIKSSPFGRALIAIRDDEIAAESIGINTRKYKVLYFAIGAFFAGIAGGIFASWLSYINPDNFTYLDSVIILGMVIVGGMGSVWGAALGAITMTITLEILRPLEIYRMAIYGLLLITFMIYRPQGLMGTAIDWTKRLKKDTLRNTAKGATK